MPTKKKPSRTTKSYEKTPPELVVANAILMAADQITRCINRLTFSSRLNEELILSCPQQIKLSAFEGGDGAAFDFEFGGKTADQVKTDAKNEAEENAKENVRIELDRKIRLVKCKAGCIRVPGTKEIRIVTAGHITNIKPDTLGLVTRYDASATAEGDVTVECRHPVGDIAPVRGKR